MHHLYPGRRSLGQRLTDTVFTGVAFLIFLVPVLMQRRADRAVYRDGFRDGANDRVTGRPPAPEPQPDGYRDGWDEAAALDREARKAADR